MPKSLRWAPKRVMYMNGYAIVRLEADALAARDGLVSKFNSFVQKAAYGLSFVHDNEGYFRLPYDEEIGAASAGIVEFGLFLVSAGCTVVGVSSRESADGEQGTEISFTAAGQIEHVFLSTVSIY